ncbi:3-isopropylmalate dehydratase small subunit [Brevibacillus laterosporus]|uniref:3-isopropylmalate dehydratase small subunit n=1 Tax=Brevibacillus laterosporus TaxID=1465 RepID=UPI00215BE6E1|nr:3-isopropylmalate dehydratase small subunit [Brevibacillus laterosporus]MCR8936364.1 3-isopropylmalate dehydratase small subunit [Brevibacillus laterosporus]MCZ0839003.1 3-isopropylmalate dehydratase small subunit [Brevibacillus laterosporus]MCZ0847335.1 3-isopropylmalate dehydratase small subunit [Brevibacillus laterosporus]
MEPFVKVTGLATPVDRANIDTDAIIPKQFLKRIERTGFGQFLFYEWRFTIEGERIDSFVLHQPRYEGATILLARNNFGCGSSREHAPWALLDFGFRVIIAPSFADIFYNNCFKNGILPIKLTEEQVEELFTRTESTEGYTLTIDLERQVVEDGNGLSYPFEVDTYRRYCLLHGLDDIGITLQQEDKIVAYEQKMTVW